MKLKEYPRCSNSTDPKPLEKSTLSSQILCVSSFHWARGHGFHGSWAPKTMDRSMKYLGTFMGVHRFEKRLSSSPIPIFFVVSFQETLDTFWPIATQHISGASTNFLVYLRHLQVTMIQYNPAGQFHGLSFFWLIKYKRGIKKHQFWQIFWQILVNDGTQWINNNIYSFDVPWSKDDVDGHPFPQRGARHGAGLTISAKPWIVRPIWRFPEMEVPQKWMVYLFKWMI